MLDIIHFVRLIKSSIATLMVVASGATALAFVTNGQAPHTATAPEQLTLSARLSTANRFRSEFPAPSENINAWWPASTQGFRLGWQRSAAAAAPAARQTMPFRD
jgi:hypothetical protein